MSVLAMMPKDLDSRKLEILETAGEKFLEETASHLLYCLANGIKPERDEDAFFVFFARILYSTTWFFGWNFFEFFDKNNNRIYVSVSDKKRLELVIGDEFDKGATVLDISELLNVIIPKNQFDYVINKKRGFDDKDPDSRGFIFSHKKLLSYNFLSISVISNKPQMFVGSSEHLISYFELTEFLRKMGVREIEISPVIISLIKKGFLSRLDSKNIDSDGYCDLAGYGKKKEICFFYKNQVMLINHSDLDKFLVYDEVLDRWGHIKKNTAQNLLLGYASPLDAANKITSIHQFPSSVDDESYFFDFDDDNLSTSKRVSFAQNAIFPESFLEEIEEYHGVFQEGRLLIESSIRNDEVVLELELESIEGDLNYCIVKIFDYRDGKKTELFRGKKFKNSSQHGKFIAKLCKMIADKESLEINPSESGLLNTTKRAKRASQMPSALGFREEDKELKSLFFDDNMSNKRVVFYKKITRKRLEEKGLSDKI